MRAELQGELVHLWREFEPDDLEIGGTDLQRFILSHLESYAHGHTVISEQEELTRYGLVRVTIETVIESINP